MNVSQLSGEWLVAFVLAVVTVVTKVATGWQAARLDRVGSRGRLRAGFALVARGEFSIVIAGLAVAAGVPGIKALATTYVLIMAILGPVLARHADTFARWLGLAKPA